MSDTRTTSQGLLVLQGGDPAAALRQGLPTADSVDAAVSRYAKAVTDAAAARLAAEQVLAVYDSAAVILAARDQALAAAQQAIINIGSQANDLNINAAIAGVVASAANAGARLDSLAGRMPVDVTDPIYGLTGTTDNTAALQAALNAAAGQRPVLIPRRPLNQPYVLTGGGSGAVLLKVEAGQVITGDATRPTLQVKAGTGDYKAIIGGTSASTDLSGLVIRNLTIDQNTPNNPVSNVATLLVNGTQRFCVLVGVGKVVTVRDVRFLNLDCLNAVYLGGPATADLRVETCDFELVGSSTARHDHSTVYVSGDGVSVFGNKFRGVPGGLGATTAIETHGRSQTVSANRVDGYQIGCNLTGVEDRGNDGVLFKLNVLQNVLIGIQLWSYAGLNGGLTDCQVTDNVIRVNRDAWALGPADFPHGICLSQSSTGHVDGLVISRNQIRFAASTTALAADYTNAAGIELVTADTSIEVRNLDIDENQVIGALGAGIRVQAKVRRGRISRNRLVDPSAAAAGGGATVYRSGIIVHNEAGTVHQDLEVHGNRTFDTRGTHKVVQGFATSVAGTLVRCSQWDNTVVCYDGVIVPATTETFGKLFSTRAEAPIAQPFTASLYYGPIGSGTAPTGAGAGTAFAFPVANSRTFDRIGCEVTTAAASSTVRLGIYADNGQGMPGALVVDAGTVDASSIGAKELPIAATLKPGLYWLLAVSQGGTPQMRGILPGSAPVSAGVSGLANATSTTARFAYVTSGVTGALPATFTFTGNTAAPILVVLRAA